MKGERASERKTEMSKIYIWRPSRSRTISSQFLACARPFSYPAMSPSQKPPELTQELFNTYNTELQCAALKATRNAVFLPADLAFYRSLDRGIAKDLDASSSRVLSLANRLIDLVSTADSAKSKSKGKARLEHDDIADNFRSSVVDSMDQLLERAVRAFF